MPRYLREFLEDHVVEGVSSIESVYEAGKLIGLTEADVNSVYRSNRGANTKSFLAEHWLVFLPVIAFVAIFILFLLFRYSDPWSSYPRGAYYGVIRTNDFEKRISARKTEIAS